MAQPTYDNGEALSTKASSHIAASVGVSARAINGDSPEQLNTYTASAAPYGFPASDDFPLAPLNDDPAPPIAITRPRRAFSQSHILSSSSVASRKARHAEPDTSDIHVQRTSPASVPYSPTAITTSRNLLASSSRRHSSHSDTGSSLDSDLNNHRRVTQKQDSSKSHSRPTFIAPSASYNSTLPSPPPSNRSSFSDPYYKRLSSNSLYSLASARGLLTNLSNAISNTNPSTVSPVSESGPPPRSVPGYMSNVNKVPGPAHSEPSVSSVHVTTASGGQAGYGIQGSHNLTTRDPHSQPLDLMRRNVRTDSRSQPDRSRSRAQRRFSGSTANSSHSPSSDRAHHREKEEGQLPAVPALLPPTKIKS